jgi:hypothetical protein
MKWVPLTVVSVGFGQVRTSSRMRPADERARFGIDERLGHIGLGEPPAVVLDHRDDVGGLSVDRDVARPRQRRAPVFTGVTKGCR